MGKEFMIVPIKIICKISRIFSPLACFVTEFQGMCKTLKSEMERVRISDSGVVGNVAKEFQKTFTFHPYPKLCPL
jgi:hypothetical protein